MALPPDDQRRADAYHAAEVRRQRREAPELVCLQVRHLDRQTSLEGQPARIETTEVRMEARVLEVKRSATALKVGQTVTVAFRRQVLLCPGEGFRNPMRLNVSDLVWAYLRQLGGDYGLAAGSGSMELCDPDRDAP